MSLLLHVGLWAGVRKRALGINQIAFERSELQRVMQDSMGTCKGGEEPVGNNWLYQYSQLSAIHVSYFGFSLLGYALTTIRSAAIADLGFPAITSFSLNVAIRISRVPIRWRS